MIVKQASFSHKYFSKQSYIKKLYKMLNSIYDSQANQFQSQVFLKQSYIKELYKMLNSVYDNHSSQFQPYFWKESHMKELYKMLKSIHDSHSSQFQSQVFEKDPTWKSFTKCWNQFMIVTQASFSHKYLKRILHERALQNVVLNLWQSLKPVSVFFEKTEVLSLKLNQ